MKLSITIGSFILAATGIVGQITNNSLICLLYNVLTTSSLLIVGAGGVVNYYRNIDFRDMQREKDLMQKEKIQILTEKLIGLEKELILSGKEEKQNISINTRSW
jgi:tetrahydromethanopterin S-methyltransferase subunit A